MVVGKAALAGLRGLARISEANLAPSTRTVVSGGRTSGIYFSSEALESRPTEVFAYLAVPHAQPVPNPAVVLLHGGTGRAFADWATMWAQRGFVALAIDLAGLGLSALPFATSGPSDDHEQKYWAIEDGVEATWMYHAVAATMHGISLLTNHVGVDKSQVHLSGISWGSHVAELAASLDTRISRAAFIYGSGYLRGNDQLAAPLEAMPTDLASQWIEEFDQSNYLAQISMPTLWISGPNDVHYPIDRFQRSFDLVKVDKTLRILPGYQHCHEVGWAPIEICEFFLASNGTALPLPSLEDIKVNGQMIAARFHSELDLVAAHLHYTTGEGAWHERTWDTVSAAIGTDLVSAGLPERTRAALLSVTDARGATVSTRFVELGARAPA